MQQTLSLTYTTIGKKVLMAVSGVVMLGFSLGHLAGNLQVFLGAEAFNSYAEKLHSLPALVWTTRVVLLGALFAHVSSAFSLWQRNKKATAGTRYAVKKDIAANYASKTMYMTGPILFFYIAFHLLHLTLGGVIFGDGAMFGIEGYVFDPHNPYNNMVHGFQNPLLVAVYTAGVVSLGFHLFHGIFSMFQTVGANHSKYNEIRENLAVGLATLITLGFLSIPYTCLFGLVTPV